MVRYGTYKALPLRGIGWGIQARLPMACATESRRDGGWWQLVMVGDSSR
jgi:hypothetical protein